MSGLKVDKLIKSKPTQKLKHTNSTLDYSEYLCEMSSKSIVAIWSYTVSKFTRFLRHSVLWHRLTTLCVALCGTKAEGTENISINITKCYYWEPIRNHQRSFERYQSRPPPTSCSLRLGFATATQNYKWTENRAQRPVYTQFDKHSPDR